MDDNEIINEKVYFQMSLETNVENQVHKSVTQSHEDLDLPCSALVT